MTDWIKIEHPKEEYSYLGFFITRDGIGYRREFWREGKKYYSFDEIGEAEEIPCPDYYRELDEEPNWMDD